MNHDPPTGSPTLEAIRDGVARHEPKLEPPPAELWQHAAVALILHEPAGGTGPELLFIERAIREGDPWSGQMAFPGGRRDDVDADLAQTALRETAEEVGVRLQKPIGRLDDHAGSRHRAVPHVVIASFVYELAERPRLNINAEVQSAIWVPVSWILHPDSASEYRLDYSEYKGTFPAFQYHGHTVWGLTYRVLESLFELVGEQMPRA